MAASAECTEKAAGGQKNNGGNGESGLFGVANKAARMSRSRQTETVAAARWGPRSSEERALKSSTSDKAYRARPSSSF